MVGEVEKEGRSYKYSRKEKSLGLLCSNFLNLYKDSGIKLVWLDDAAGKLGVERRRIYDIVNVLESVGVLTRKGKNRYAWIGLSGIPQALNSLKEEALREVEGDETLKPVSLVEYPDDESESNEPHPRSDCGEEKNCLNLSVTVGSVYCNGERGLEYRREKSLGLFTRNFLKLFFITGEKTISLDDAAKSLLGHGYSCHSKNNAAKVRRLYDIANVLSSLTLIDKIQNSESRKPAFRWLGLNGKLTNSLSVENEGIEKLSKRAFGSDITNVDLKKRKRQTIHQTKSDDLKECNLTAQRQLQNSAGIVFGPFFPSQVDKKFVEAVPTKKACDWETLTESLHPRYHNQGWDENSVLKKNRP
ncbi:E2F transcription factor-like E2FE isoform X2 [Wolffia australiana]